MEKLLKKLGQLQYEISLLGLDEEEVTGVSIRTDELKELIKQGQKLPIDSVSKRYQVTDIQLADWESVAICDTKTNKIVCHFITENSYDEAVKLANKINDFLNVC